MIITHSAKGDIDEFLAIAFASYAMGDACIRRIKHADVQKTIKGMSELDTMINIGGVFNPSIRVFDHHQNKALNASVIETANFFEFKLPKDSLWGYFSDLTTKGLLEATELHSLGGIETKFIHDIVRVTLMTWDLVLPEGTTNTSVFITIGDYLRKQDFNLGIQHLVGIKNLVQKAYPEQYEKAIKQLGKEGQ